MTYYPKNIPFTPSYLEHKQQLHGEDVEMCNSNTMKTPEITLKF